VNPRTFLDGKIIVHPGDMLEVLDGLDENAFDSCVCDPPYHLTSIVKRFGGDTAAAAQFGADGAFSRASRGFMNKVWDGGDIAFQINTWAREPEYLADIERRCSLILSGPDARRNATIKAKGKAEDAGPLFGGAHG
jgi:tRNA G10  N-methylase Trm11